MMNEVTWILSQEEAAEWTLRGLFAGNGPTVFFLLMEDSGFLLLENGDKLILE